MSTRYVLHDSIGSGGMATVHLGHLHAPLGFRRVVAIKRLHPGLSRQAEFAAMLVDEARITARVRHLNVIPTLDVFLEEGECFLVMEYVEGESLAKLLRSASQADAPVPLGVVSAILGGVLRGLHAAHVAKSANGDPLNIIHRDVSPQNVIVGSDGIARVFDFGVAKALGRLQQTRAGEFKGKLPYLAPEQFGDGKLDRRVDVYAASVTLWEALTTRRLFDGGSEEEVFGKILQSRIPAPSELRSDIPAAVDQVVLRGLSRAPGDRFASAADMALALEQATAPAPPREVAAWLESLAGEALAKRAALVTEIDSGARAAASTGEPEAAPGSAADTPEASPLISVAEPSTPIPTPDPPEQPEPAITQRMTVPLRAKPAQAWRTDALNLEEPAPHGPGALGGLGSSTPPPHSLPVVEPGRPRRVAVRASLGAVALLCSLAAPAFGWMAYTDGQEAAHAAAAPANLKSTTPKLVPPARPLEQPGTAAPSGSSARAPQAPTLKSAEPKAAVGPTASAFAALPLVVPSQGVATGSPPGVAKPRSVVKSKSATNNGDYLSSAPYSQRR